MMELFQIIILVTGTVAAAVLLSLSGIFTKNDKNTGCDCGKDLGERL